MFQIMFAFISLSYCTRGFSVTGDRRTLSFIIKTHLSLASLKTCNVSHRLSFLNLPGLFQLCSDAPSFCISRVISERSRWPIHSPWAMVWGWDRGRWFYVVQFSHDPPTYDFATPCQRFLTIPTIPLEMYLLHLLSHLTNGSASSE